MVPVMSARAHWIRWLLPRTVPARIVLVIALLCAPWSAWRGWCWWVNARTAAWAKSTGGWVEFADPRPGDPLAEWREHPALGTIDGIQFGGDRPVAPAELGRLRWLPGLRGLSLDGGTFTDEHLARLPALPGLETLYLDTSSITDAGLEALAHRKSLISLSLSHTPVTDAGMPHLSGLTELKNLYLFGTAVGDTGLRALRPLADLALLGVGERVTDAGIDEIVRHQKLRRLAFEGSPVTDAGMERLIRDLPGCKRVSLYRTRVSPAMVATMEAKGIAVEFSP
jgi:hypothetical protein